MVVDLKEIAPVSDDLVGVYSIVMVVREMLPRLPEPLGCMASPFPLRREKKAVA